MIFVAVMIYCFQFIESLQSVFYWLRVIAIGGCVQNNLCIILFRDHHEIWSLLFSVV